MKKHSIFISLLPFWLFVLFFKFGAGLHFTLLSTLGSHVFPIWAVGLLIGGAAFFQMILDVPAGYLLDRFGYTRVLRIFTLVFIAGAAALFLGLTQITFIITLLLAELGWLFFNPGANAYMLSKAHAQSAGKFIGFFHTIASSGIVLAAFLLPFMIDRPPAIIAATLSIIVGISFLAIVFTPKETTSVHAERKIVQHTYYIRRHFIGNALAVVKKLNPVSGILLLQNFVAALFYGAIWFSIPLAFAQNGLDEFLGWGLGIFDLAIVLLGSSLGALADRLEKRRMIFFGLLIFAIASSIIGFTLNIWFLVLGFLATAGDEMASVSLWAWLDRLDKNHDQDGLLNGAIVLFEDFGWAIGPIIAGFLFVPAGVGWTLALCSVPIFIVWFISVFFLRNHSSLPIHGAILEIPHRARHKS